MMSKKLKVKSEKHLDNITKMPTIAGALLFLFVICGVGANAQTAAGYVSTAYKAVQAGNYEEAAKYYSKAMAADSLTAVYCMPYRGWCYYHSGDFVSARSDFENALLLPNKDVDVYVNAINYYTKTKNHKRAFEIIGEGLKIDTLGPHSRSLLLALKVEIKTETRDFEGAYADAMDAYRADTNSLDLRLAIADNFDEWGKPKEAIKWYYKAVMVSNDDWGILNSVAFLYNEIGEYDNAIEECNTIIELLEIEGEKDDNQSIAYAYNNKSFAEFKLGNTKQALKDVNKSIKLFPGNAYAFKNRALYYIENKDTKSACEDLKKAKELGFKALYGDEVDKLIQQHCK